MCKSDSSQLSGHLRRAGGLDVEHRGVDRRARQGSAETASCSGVFRTQGKIKTHSRSYFKNAQRFLRRPT